MFDEIIFLPRQIVRTFSSVDVRRNDLLARPTVRILALSLQDGKSVSEFTASNISFEKETYFVL
jgi:hypothetical protein